MSLEDERKFLHDLANPLAIAQGSLKIALRKLTGMSDGPQVTEILERLTKAMEACDKMANQVGERRRALAEQINPEAS